MPDTQLFADVIGQDGAVSSLRAAIVRPVHAYLLVGPAGSGKRASALSFAASLLCAAGGDGTCDICRRVLGGIHPDLVVFEREGPWITVGMAQQVSVAAARSPMEGDRKVLMLSDFHLVKEAGPALLKTIEEPPPSTVFVITAEFIPPELVTIASRCVVIEFRPLTLEGVAAALQAGGVEVGLALELATAADGRLDRARLLAGDPEFGVRRRAWQAVPERLDGNGATAVAIAGQLVAHLERSVAPLRTRHEAEVAELDARLARANEVTGGKAGKRPAKTGAKGSRSATAARSAGSVPTNSGPVWRRWPASTVTGWLLVAHPRLPATPSNRCGSSRSCMPTSPTTPTSYSNSRRCL